MKTFRKDGDSQAQQAAVHNIDGRHDPLKMVSPRHSGQLFKSSTNDRVKKERRPAVSLYLKRITKLKCVNSEIKSNVESTAWKGIPLGVPTILSRRQEGHTCLEKLFELLTWNVLFMQMTPTQNKMRHVYIYIYVI